MFLLKFDCNSTDSRKVVGEDISPIRKKTQSQNCFTKFDSENNSKEINEDNDDTRYLISKLRTVNIGSGDTNDYQYRETNIKEIKNNIKNDVHKKKNDKFLSKVHDKPLMKENICTSTQPADTKKPKTTRTRTKKKKDSFIVSDDSSISNDSITIYHQVLTKNIKADVRKMTPRSRFRRLISSNDDGIFTPYIIGKRSSSESSPSDDENDNDKNPAKLKLPKSRIYSPDAKLKNSISDLKDYRDEKRTDSTSSSDEFRLFKPEKKNYIPSASVNSPSIVDDSKPSVPRNFLKDFSWIFTNDDSSSSDEKKLLKAKNFSKFPNIQSINENNSATPLNEKCSSKEKPCENNEKASMTPTPITFHLKQVNKLTPKGNTNKKEEPMSFLKSLSIFNSPHINHPEAEPYKKKFKKLKEELASKLFKIFNEQVFDKQLPSDLKIEWSGRLRSSSGLCYNRRIKNVIGPNNECLRASRIALSTKIIETPDRLRDTLIHEMCHAAAWIIDNQCDGHGPHWRSWAAKAMKTFPELPLIRRCHDYVVNTKFKYKCVKCGYTIGRHSKSLNLERKRCGYCYGQFELILNQKNSAKSNTVGTSPKNVKARPLSKFALFVKENYGKIKSEKPDSKHGEIMKELSKNFACTKISNE